MLETDDDKKDSLIDAEAELNSCVCKIVAAVKQKQTMYEPVVYVDTEGNDAIAYVYDFRKIRMSSTMTLDKLGEKFFGNADYASLIAYYNNIQNEHEIEAGTIIKIPILRRTNQMQTIVSMPFREILTIMVVILRLMMRAILPYRTEILPQQAALKTLIKLSRCALQQLRKNA